MDALGRRPIAAMSHKKMIQRHRYRRRPRDWSEGNGAIFALIAALMVVMAVLAFTLSGNMPLGPILTASAPTTAGEGGALREAPETGAR
jgi:hypothetical protein